ncbi:CHAP domain-containing protein [Sphingomonas nostoxanthinifaciens]|uniref:CHAP domain-containing protein n=1 Tax=Sphingomonas nostoxanthinifaciens TaxID=2872652 RepID=UPI001CC1E181|nr:CHAP domain-containing protein [Sphingomonas nostoxanthinifaciens]UAK24473.1 CHAP domain-containing protein [Sphingomonas nostoxanthinifaciens]
MFKQIKAAFGSALFIAALSLPSAANAQTYWQCAPFARMFSGIQLFGAAAGWWHQAIGRYAQGSAPKLGSVLVFKAIGSMRSGHVATVTKVISDRIIKVTHANWGTHGGVEHDVTVVDASANGDWSAVKVWYAPISDVGTHAYPTYGFIYGGARALAQGAEAAAQRIDGTTDGAAN